VLQAIKCHLGFLSESLCHPGLPDAKNAADRIWLKETLSVGGSFNLFSTSGQTHIYPVSRYTKKSVSVEVEQISVVFKLHSTSFRLIYKIYFYN